jgi:GNAT superfamily N-acetyltransferase
MIECPVNYPALPKLFDPQVPNNPALWAVFKGKHSGRALVDDPGKPTQCLLRTEAVLTYASQGMSQAFLERAIEHFRNIGHIWLVRNPGDAPAPPGYKRSPRLEFYDYDPSSPILINFRQQLPEGFYVQNIDMDLLQRCEWRDDMEFYCGSLANFLRHGVGICWMRGDEIIVEAFASALGSSYAEIGAITHQPYRGKGYAPISVAYLIKLLEERGYHAYWSCDLDNPASARVAHKLGFATERPYEIFEYVITK